MKTWQMREKFIIAAAIFIILLFLLLNIYTPLIADDFSYSNGIHSISDIFVSQYHSYFNWGGRCVAHFIAQFWLLVGKPFFNIANTIVYCAFILLIQFHIKGNMKKPDLGLFLVLNIFFWLFVPVWGQDFLWLTGSCNYLWTTVIILFFLVPFRKKQDNPVYKWNIPLSVLFFFVGIFAGWSNENSGAAVLFLLIGYFTINIKKKDRLALFEILGTIGFLLGFSLMIAAPGNYVRAEVVRQMGDGYSNDPLLIMLFKRFVSVTMIFKKNHMLLLVFISLFLGFDIQYHQKRKLPVFSYFYFLAVLASTYSMVLSPSFPDRAFLIVIIFSIIVLGTILRQVEMPILDIVKRNIIFITDIIKNNKVLITSFVKRNIVFIIVLVVICLSISILNGTKKIIGVYLRWYDRIEYITEEKEKGNLTIKTKPIIVTNNHVALYGLSDISSDKTEWTNTDITKYFGLQSIESNDELPENLWLNKRRRINQLIKPQWRIVDKLRER